jgi:hypothetical protein
MIHFFLHSQEAYLIFRRRILFSWTSSPIDFLLTQVLSIKKNYTMADIDICLNSVSIDIMMYIYINDIE